jgi:hypothetical protein
MKLEFLDDISNGGKFAGVVTDQLVRLYNFDKLQAGKLRQTIQREIIEKNVTLNLSKLEFIETINCSLILRLANIEIGITTCDKINYCCELTKGGYQNMVDLLEPFCIQNRSGYQWLYDIDTPIGFLFSPNGDW